MFIDRSNLWLSLIKTERKRKRERRKRGREEEREEGNYKPWFKKTKCSHGKPLSDVERSLPLSRYYASIKHSRNNLLSEIFLLPSTVPT